jgi:hypothetical protein
MKDRIIRVAKRFIEHCIKVSEEAEEIRIKREMLYLEQMAIANAYEKEVYKAICIQPSKR